MTNSTGVLRAREYFGERTREFQTSGFLLAESVYSERASLPMHAHDNAHFCLVLSGSYTESVEGCEIERRAGDLVFYRAGVAHAECHHSSGRHLMIEVDSEFGDGAGDSPSAFLRGPSRSLATRLFAEFRSDERVPGERLGGLVRRLLDVASRPPVEPIPAWLREVERRLHTTEEGTPKLKGLAEEAGVHPVYLGRVFRRVHGCTPGEYLRRLRVERAQRALGAADAELADVAFDSGFCDQSHLNRVFKRETGMTPGHYRRLADPRELS